MKNLYEFAPAKLNLYLHITGRREDGYHNLDSLVAFASLGDDIQLKPAADFYFSVEGKYAEALAKENKGNNLVVKAARSLAELTGKKLDAHLILIKNLPVASGIGGGSSDAAAALRVLAKHWKLNPNDLRIAEAASLHGQDVPVCLNTDNSYIAAKGIAPSPKLPRADIVLVNPNKSLPTPEVYQEYRKGNDPFSPVAKFEQTPADVNEMAAALKLRSNDLYAPACRLLPEITEVIDSINKTERCLLSRMSGSGATCFGIYPNFTTAKIAAETIGKANPNWWVESGVINA